MFAVNVAGTPKQPAGAPIVTCGFGFTTSVAEAAVAQPFESVITAE